jgi:hypothetical protein
MVVEPGKDLAPLVTTAEESTSPLTAVGESEVAFLIGPEPHQTIGVADVPLPAGESLSTPRGAP